MDVEDLQLFKVTFDEAESNGPGWTGAKKKKNPITEPTGTLKNESAFKCRYLLIEISQTSSLVANRTANDVCCVDEEALAWRFVSRYYFD